MTTVETTIRSLADAAAADIAAPPDLASRALRGARTRRRRRLAITSGVVAVGLGLSVGAYRIGSGPYRTEIQPSWGMAPTISAGQQVAFRRDLDPAGGDVVRIELPQDAGVPTTLSRVIGVGGQTVGCPAEPDGTCTGVRVDGQLVSDPYLSGLTTAPFDVVSVPQGEVFVLGDNRSAALDSRVFGPLSLDGIDAVVVAVRVAGRYHAIPGAPPHRLPQSSDSVDPPGPVPTPGVAPAGD